MKLNVRLGLSFTLSGIALKQPLFTGMRGLTFIGKKACKLYRQIRMSDVIFASRPDLWCGVYKNKSNEKCYKTSKNKPIIFATLLFLLETDIMAPVFIAALHLNLPANIIYCWLDSTHCASQSALSLAG